MYTLYYSPGTCATATQVILLELGQDVKIVDRAHVADFAAITPIQAVPVLVDGEHTLTEGAAIILHLLTKHENTLLPSHGFARQNAIQNILFANATMHPAYSRLFFIAANIDDEAVKQSALNQAADAISTLWRYVESLLQAQPYLGGNAPSAADILLAVYATWGAYFPVDINIGPRSRHMIETVQAMPNFQRTIEAQRIESEKNKDK
ncbi:glutathione S-transferase family protein [Vibrio fluvialis]|uniref:glutathione S-transferase family protein n=1 Tax=Vibrio fluvialis TaxID=676 RepID=UPI001C9CF651|nr:glutathione S-transferase family protein [Vibrio fluvialis]MBY7931188.1 glutathione S-transferase family protein [Vibrio fluvialis]MBY8182778.1 glutathione S-transferase family protein [Vibrio fluvialis]MBY8213082.1 glutathione S-transferase family protein [Vibrio fluvialis]MCE7655235.1 glutathione S-transferase family protein [Vibrio fluvialis]BEI25293.1 glutathione transferase GstA [Vibrio fluvialis]